MNEISTIQKCICMRNGVQIWIDAEKADKLVAKLVSLRNHVFIEVNGRAINTADIIEVVTAQDMEQRTRHYNGQWQCKYGKWHEKNEKCEHRPAKEILDEMYPDYKPPYYLQEEKGFVPLGKVLSKESDIVTPF